MYWIVVAGMALVALALVVFPLFRGKVSREVLLMIALATAVPLSGLIGYAIGTHQSSPTATMPAPDDAATAPAAPDPAQMVARLEARLKAGSGTPQEWAMLARSYVTLQRHKEAAEAYAKATQTITDDAQMFADYADALAMGRGGLDQDSEALIDRALKVDPLNPKALALKATVAYNRHDYAAAIDLWQKMLTVPGLSQEWANSARGNIEEARSLLRQPTKQ